MKTARRTPKDTTGAAVKPRQFTGTANPRHLRVIVALGHRMRSREDIDRIAGASNGPEVIAELRRRGLDIPCDRVPCYDRDGREVKRGIYSLTGEDRRRVLAWRRRRDSDPRKPEQQAELLEGEA
ncbi:hypothetical protein SAMN05421778_10550 [Sphaerotilus natans]|nr:hypothetical protein [Sphaerotilus natans]SIQ85039.1 hypothetical protein SAMN05421778_10550 [Sphaerotilus natans]